MKYTPATLAKAIMAFITAFGGAAATSAPHDAIGWAGCAGAGLVAFAAVFATPNKSADTAPEVSPADQVIAALPTVVEQATQAVAELDRVKQATADVLGTVPVVGPLAKQAIDSVKLP